MRILHVLDHSLPVSDGYAFRSHSIIREQRHIGWRTAQLTGPKQGPCSSAEECVNGLVYLRTSSAGGSRDKWLLLSVATVVTSLRARLKEVIDRERPDVLHVHSPCLNGLAALGLGLPLVYELRSSWEDAAVSNGSTAEGSIRYRLSRAFETHVLRQADAVVTICQGLKQDVLDRGVPAERVTVVPNAVSPDELPVATQREADAARKRLGLTGSWVVGFVGSFFAWEGLSVLLEALPAMRRVRPDIRLLLVGSGNEEAALREQARRLGTAESVLFAGRVPHQEVSGLYAAIDILVYPRLPMRLTDMVTPLKPLEAMSLGKLLVASDVGGHREMVDDHETGVLFKAGDAAGLANAVLELSHDAALQRVLRDNGPRYVQRERLWSKVVPRYEGVYKSVLSRK